MTAGPVFLADLVSTATDPDTVAKATGSGTKPVAVLALVESRTMSPNELMATSPEVQLRIPSPAIQATAAVLEAVLPRPVLAGRYAVADAPRLKVPAFGCRLASS